jgi:hypothetical protein
MTTMEDGMLLGSSIYPIGWVSDSASNFVVAESSVLRINIWAKMPPLRKTEKRYSAFKRQVP